MFPSNLHKNILQLDKQISLLESECKVMEMERRKKCANFKEPLTKCSKSSNLQSKSPPVRDTKKYGYGVSNVKGKKKSTPSVSSRAHSTGSMVSKCSKQWVDSRSSVQRKEREHDVDLQVCSCHALGNLNIHSNFKKESKSTKCMCCDDSVSDTGKNNKICHDVDDYKNQNQVLHKEVLFSNPGGTIEVTVTQKSSIDKQNDNLKKEKTFNADKDPLDRHLESCKCQSKFGQSISQKWSEIFWMNSANKKEVMCNNLHPFESASGKEPVSMTVNKENIDTATIMNHNFARTRKSTSNVKKERNESQTCCAKENCCKDSLISFLENNPAKVFQLFNNRFEQKQSEQSDKSPVKDKQTPVSKQFTNQSFDVQDKLLEENKTDVHDLNNQNYNFLYAVKKLCDGLMTEKKSLSEKLAAKDNIIATMKNREEEYLSLISNLKCSLSKAKKNVQDSVSALKELDITKQKLLEQVKVSEALRLSHSEMQRIMEKCILENERLKTEIQIFRLESQKHDVLLAGKEAEINRYKEEIENFQKQISYHLATLKSNAQEIDVEKMMEVIIQQSQIFIQTDLESILLEPDQKDSQKQNNKLMHSSPTSTKTSAVNSSWKQISSIRDNDQNQGNIDNMYTPTNEEGGSREKEFFQIFGAADLKSDSSKEGSNQKKPSRKGGKETSSFTSCTSVQGDNDWVDLSTAKEEASTGKEREIVGAVTAKMVQNNIDELLENMKMKWSREIYDMSPNEETIHDFLSSSQISSVSVNNESNDFKNS